MNSSKPSNDNQPVGTWQRSLNDFFNSDPGRLTISVPFILVNIYLTLLTLRRNPARINHLIGRMWLFIPLLMLIWYVAVLLNNVINPYPPVLYDPHYRGFHLSVIPRVAIIGLCAFWLLEWSKISLFCQQV